LFDLAPEQPATLNEQPMNYLAHAYLSFNNPDILEGNMINDYVKGKKKFDYTEGIQKGMTLHRAIDGFTDDHPVVKKAKEYFRADYRLYAGAFVDVVFDHFLAKDENEFADNAALASFAVNTYEILQSRIDTMPERFQKMFPYMVEQNWLYNYQHTDMIQKSFSGLSRRAAYITETVKAFDSFMKHYDALQSCYDEFFPQLKAFTVHQLITL
jgi:acyl carrier protein phosphodiesterase